MAQGIWMLPSTTYDNPTLSDGDLRVHAEVPDNLSDENGNDPLFDDWALPILCQICVALLAQLSLVHMTAMLRVEPRN